MSRPPLIPIELPCPSARRALEALSTAARLAMDAGRQEVDFALELQALGQVGVDFSVLRWLIAKGLVEHLEDTSQPGGQQRSLKRVKNLSFRPGACFVITEKGRNVLEKLPFTATVQVVQKPRWDKDRRELWLGDALVKAFRVPAPNQEAVLAAFEELGWPARIDDPLPNRGADGDIRLRETIKALNKSQGPGAIQFRADGTGQGLVWEVL